MFDQVLEKLGIYDLIAVLLTGVRICIATILLLDFFDLFSINFSILSGGTTLLFLIISYFVGIVFQEYGSTLMKLFRIENSLLLQKSMGISAGPTDDLSIRLTEAELKMIKEYLKNKKLNENDVIYNYCKYKVSNDGTTMLTKDQSIGTMSRSLFLYFLVVLTISILSFLAVVVLGVLFHLNDFSILFFYNYWWLKMIMVICLSLAFTLIFYLRAIRFYRIRYVKIFRKFLYYNILKDGDVSDSETNSNHN